MKEYCFIYPTPRGAAHTLWVLGHLAFIETLVIHEFMLAKPNPLVEWVELFDGPEATKYSWREIQAERKES